MYQTTAILDPGLLFMYRPPGPIHKINLVSASDWFLVTNMNILTISVVQMARTIKCQNWDRCATVTPVQWELVAEGQISLLTITITTISAQQVLWALVWGVLHRALLCKTSVGGRCVLLFTLPVWSKLPAGTLEFCCACSTRERVLV